MPKATVNLTASTVIEEIDNFLSTYPDNHPYHNAVKNPEFYRQLIAFVLNKIPSKFAILEDDRGRPIYPDFQCASLEKRLKIEETIEQGFQAMLANIPVVAQTNRN